MIWRNAFGLLLALAAMLILSGCDRGEISVSPAAGTTGAPRLDKVALLTPTATFGQEENRQSLALSFSDQAAKLRPDLKIMTLAETLSAINMAGLAETYDRMSGAYRSVGLFDREPLRQIGEAVGARYLLQLKLQGVDQSSKQRFAYFGVSLLQTQSGTVRVFAQIWDSWDGRVAWEGTVENARQTESIRERRIGLQSLFDGTTAALVRQLPSG